MTKRLFNKELLDETLKRDKATLIGCYEKLNRDTNIKFICNCGVDYSKTFRMIENSGMICKECTEKIRQINRKKTTLEKYGVEHSSKCKEIMEKVEKTNLEKYGVKHPLQSKQVMDKVVNTNLQKYGVENVFQNKEVKNKIKETSLKKYGVEHPFMNPEIQKKQHDSNIMLYGVKNPFQSAEIKQKIKETNLVRYGTEHPSQSEQIKIQKKKTTFEHYGVENPLQSKEIRDKIKSTNLERYGVEVPTQCVEIQEKAQKNAKKFKEYKFPSGNIRKVQGFEPLALDELIKGGYTEAQILTERKEVPHIQYEVEGKKRYYFPDIHIPHENRIIEVKSTWTYKCKTDNIELKKQACIDLGYKYEIWCYDSKKNRIEV